ncbi:hypothetical protein D3C71_1340230 [compost metagenome]
MNYLSRGETKLMRSILEVLHLLQVECQERVFELRVLRCSLIGSMFLFGGRTNGL